MALLSLRSTNPDFSYIISKNPTSGLLVRENRQGHSSGWFSKNDPQQYNVWFKDAETDVSYKSHPDESFEYVNTSRFNSAMFVLNALGDFFASTFKKQHEKDLSGYMSKLKINLMFVANPKYLLIFQQYFTDFTLTHREVAPKNYEIEISTVRPIRDLLNYANLLAVFNVLKNGADFFDVEEAAVTKYMNCLTALDAPYFVRYVFKVNLLRGNKLFSKFREILEKSSLYGSIKLTHGNTAIQREVAILNKLGALERQVLDVGCGEGNYVRKIASKLPEGLPYLAVDIDPECREEVESLCKRKQLENVQIFANLDDVWTVKEKTDVLLVEVIEHMPMPDAEALVKKVFSGKINIGKVLITTPNKAFNQFYDTQDEHTRHDDHHFELTEPEFRDFLLRTVPDGYTIEMFWIGDVVNGIPTTLAATVQPAEEYTKERGVHLV